MGEGGRDDVGSRGCKGGPLRSDTRHVDLDDLLSIPVVGADVHVVSSPLLLVLRHTLQGQRLQWTVVHHHGRLVTRDLLHLGFVGGGAKSKGGWAWRDGCVGRGDDRSPGQQEGLQAEGGVKVRVGEGSGVVGAGGEASRFWRARGRQGHGREGLCSGSWPRPPLVRADGFYAIFRGEREGRG